MTTVTLRVNGTLITKEVSPRTHLADFVREHLNLTGTHIGCEHGVCGACTMMVDGRPIRSCINYAIGCAGSDVRTVEWFDDEPVMSLLRGAFSRHHALQCGYCTPGMLATSYDIVTRLPDADEGRIREELSGNLCRCTGYVGIVAAIRDVLASGPHRNTLPKERPTVSPTTSSGRRELAVRPRAEAALDMSSAEAKPELIDGVSLSRSIALPVPPDRLWQTLQNVEAVGKCLPGAVIEGINPDGSVVGALQVAIGPMSARFRGKAWVSYDATSRSGEVRGSGGDSLSRSRADGAIRFAARSDAGDGSFLDITMLYKLTGPLAQFGRPAIVATVADRLLGEVADNLARVSQGETLTQSAPIGGIGFALATLIELVRRLLLKGPRS
jgi:aerobic carbon-monoxide dehydrogenase small subunit